ncbi:rta1 domain protein [Ophiostoma piceae UAMH 11346]|uniref:Rta1 domain protein n=1 Tax=Ophiostoma piceae (strain UAMH 11346) TaxID=1262450 RepID=S3D954_OPHP1|nr:rta1 domain protein [Ophiostoma piceae UAMH 11346]
MAIEISYYPFYNPSAAAAGVMCALFAIGFIVSAFQTIRYKSWIWLVMLLAIAMEVVGFGARIGSALGKTNRTLYIIQFCLVILAPVFMAGIIYVAFGRIVFHVVPPEARTTRLLWVPPRWLTPIFVFFDIFALLLQLIGAVIISATQVTDKNAVSKLHVGKDIALAGVSAQIGAFGLFSIIAARFHFTSRRFAAGLEGRYRPLPPPQGNKFVTLVDDQSVRFKPQWRKLLYTLNFSCIMIIIRSIYREVEFATGKNGYTQRHEWFTYVLDALPIFLLVVGYTITPPGAYVCMGFRQQPKQKDQISQQAYPMRGISSSS